MKRTFIILLWAVAAATAVLFAACDGSSSNDVDNGGMLYPIEVDDEWGYIDAKGNIVIEPQFTRAGQFVDGLALAAVRTDSEWYDSKYGYINTKGEFVIEPHFIDAEDFDEGIAVVAEHSTNWSGWQYTFINTKGEPLFSYNLDENEMQYGGRFSEGMMIVCKYDGREYPKSGYIDLNGNLAIGYRFELVQNFSEGLAAVNIGNTGAPETGRYGYVNHNGEMEIKEQFVYAGDFSEGLAAVQVGEGDTAKWGYINKKGEMVIQPVYDYAGPFHQGRASVGIGKYEETRWGFIDRKGQMVIEPHLTMPSDFSENGLAQVCSGEHYCSDNKASFIDTTGRTVLELDLPRLSKLAGFELNNWHAEFTKDGKLLVVTMEHSEWEGRKEDRTYRWGYMNLKGEFIWMSKTEESQLCFVLE